MKNYIIGFCFLAGAFFLIWKQSEEQIERAKEASPSTSLPSDSNFTAAVIDSNDSVVKSNLRIVGEANAVAINEPLENEILTETLSNEFSSLTFTNYLGGLRSVNLHKHDRLSKSYEMTQPGEPFLGISFHKMDGSEINLLAIQKISSSQMRVHQTKFHLNGYRMKR